MKNIFYSKAKEKNNPDILLKKNKLNNDRKEIIFKKNNIVYNSITNSIPSNITNQNDLLLNIDKPIENINDIISKKIKERQSEDSVKPAKQKIIVDTNSNEQTNTYIEQKQIYNNFSNVQNKEINDNKNKHHNILKDLKDLGIINNN